MRYSRYIVGIIGMLTLSLSMQAQRFFDLTADKVKSVVEEHLKGGKPVTEYTIAAHQL